MVFVRKFSEFPPGTLDEGVGLAAGANTRGPAGTGGSGGVTEIIEQVGHGFAKGTWVRIDVATQLYVRASCADDLDAEAIGVVIEGTETNPNFFTLQQSGYIKDSKDVFGGGLLIGQPYYLSTTPGVMTNTDTTIDGQVSRPVFIPDGVNQGWVIPYRGYIIGGGTDVAGGGGTVTDSNIVTVTQTAHGFNPGQWLRVSNPNLILEQPVYVLAKADTLANSQSVGVVIEILNANQFKLQFSGYNRGAVTQDYLLMPLNPSSIYYLSPTDAGEITSVNPSAFGQISKPLYVSEQVASGLSSTGIDAGYILPQRPLSLYDENNNDTKTIVKANAFQKGQWVYIQGPADDTYALAKADTFASSQVAGVVISDFDASQFTVQQSGWIDGVVNGTYVDGGAGTFVNGNVLYLSDTTAGNLTATPPAVVGNYSKPCYVQQNAARVGQILPQRPLIIPSTGGGGGDVLIETRNFVNVIGDTGVSFSGIFDGTYSDIKIVIRDLVMRQADQAPIFFNGDSLRLQLEIGGVRKTDLNYKPAGTLAPNRFDVTFLILGEYADTANGKCWEAVININGITTNDRYKFLTASQRYWSGSDLTVKDTGGAGSLNTSYIGSTLPVTGFYLFTDNPQMRFVSGQISVYGTVS